MSLKKRGFIKGRNGQAAIFLILAAIILFGGIYYISTKTVLKERQTKVPKEFEPVVLLVDECIRQKTEEGLQTIGLTGGYIDYPDNVLNNPRSYIPSPPEFSDFKIPYWWYDGKTAIPPESFIKAQLEKFIKSNATGCLDNFRELESQFDVTEKGGMNARVAFNEEDVSVNVEYEIEASSKLDDQKITIKNFFYDSGTRFRKVYGLAKQIMERQANGFFFEEKTIDLMSLDLERRIPLVGLAFECGTKKWRLSDAKNRLQELLRVNLPYAKVIGTDINLQTYVPNPCALAEYKGHRLCKPGPSEPPTNYDNTYESSYYSKHYLWEVAVNPGQTYGNMEVSFRYDNWPMRMDARPREGAFLKSNSQKGAGVLRFLCTNIWKFTYDISYPVMASILDKPSLKNNGYLFNFPFKVAVRGNMPDRQATVIVPFDEPEQISSDDYCREDLQSPITIVDVKDTVGNAVDDVDIEFTCGKFTCSMGRTGFKDPSETIARLEKQFPVCTQGVIRASKEGYIENTTTGIIADNTPRASYNIKLTALKEFGKYNQQAGRWTTYKVFKIQLIKPKDNPYAKLADSMEDYTFYNVKMDVADAPDEKATIAIQDANSEHETHGLYPTGTEEAVIPADPNNPGSADRVSEQAPISLLRDYDKTYELGVYLVDRKTNEVKGAYEGEWPVRRQDVQNKDSIELYAIEFVPNTYLTQEEQDDDKAVFLDNIEYFSTRLKQELGLGPALK